MWHDSTHTHGETNDPQDTGSGVGGARGKSLACAVAADGDALLLTGTPRIRPTRDSPMLRCDANESGPIMRTSDTDSTSVGWAAELSSRRARGAEETVYTLVAVACIVSDDSIFNRARLGRHAWAGGGTACGVCGGARGVPLA